MNFLVRVYLLTRVMYGAADVDLRDLAARFQGFLSKHSITDPLEVGKLSWM